MLVLVLVLVLALVLVLGQYWHHLVAAIGSIWHHLAPSGLPNTATWPLEPGNQEIASIFMNGQQKYVSGATNDDYRKEVLTLPKMVIIDRRC